MKKELTPEEVERITTELAEFATELANRIFILLRDMHVAPVTALCALRMVREVAQREAERDGAGSRIRNESEAFGLELAKRHYLRSGAQNEGKH